MRPAIAGEAAEGQLSGDRPLHESVSNSWSALPNGNTAPLSNNRYLGVSSDMVQGQLQVQLKDIRKTYESTTVLHTLNLDVAQHEFISLLGPSGCGKTTTLNIIAGFITPESGDVLLAGRPVGALPPNRRGLGMVFQRYALFPHLNIFENIAFGLRLRRASADHVRRTVEKLLDLVHLPHVAKRFPGELSGGQQQRVALARALAVEPQVLLLDEPLSSLDAQLRREMQVELRRIHEELKLTSIYVTHDQEEALVMSDRIAVMNRGRVEQFDTPKGIYDHPRTAFVASFIGEANLLRGKVLERNGQHLRVGDCLGSELVVVESARVTTPPVGSAVELAIREEKIRITREPESANSVRGRLERVVYQGSSSRCFCNVAGYQLRAKLGPAEAFESGDEIYVTLPPNDIILLEPSPVGGEMG